VKPSSVCTAGEWWNERKNREWDILGIGDIDVDLCLRVDRLPGRDEKVFAELLGEFPGGMTANVCCAARRFGARSAMIGTVGTDPYGGMAMEGLLEHGVDTSLVRVVEGGRTFFCVVLLDESGEKALTVVRTDRHLPGKADMDPEDFGRSRLVHVIGDDAEFVEWAAIEARGRGALVSVDMEASTTARGARGLVPLLRHVDVAFFNESGYRGAFGGDARTALGTVLGLGPRVVVITRGAEGSLVGSSDEQHAVPGHRVEVVDSTGAGDCFIGAFLTYLLEGVALRDCARFATAAAALSLGGVGARSALPTRAAVLDLLAAAPPIHHPEDLT